MGVFCRNKKLLLKVEVKKSIREGFNGFFLGDKVLSDNLKLISPVPRRQISSDLIVKISSTHLLAKKNLNERFVIKGIP